MTAPHKLGDMTWTEFERWRNDRAGLATLLLVPLGSCEQHGPHLPVDTDLRIAELLCEQALNVSEFPEATNMVIAPAVTIGASGEHSEFPATLSIGSEVLTHVLVELARSALPEPALGRPSAGDGVVLVNGHGGNIEACQRAVSVLQSESRNVSAWHPQVPSGDSHAGRTETSMLLATNPEAVRHDHIGAGTLTRWRDIGPQVFDGGLRDVAPTGVLGDPRVATKEEGHEVIAGLVADLRAHLTAAVHALQSTR